MVVKYFVKNEINVLENFKTNQEYFTKNKRNNFNLQKLLYMLFHTELMSLEFT